MEFYPYAFEIGPDDREVRIGMSTKKGSGADAVIRIVGIQCPKCEELELPKFWLVRDSTGSRLLWDGPLDEEICVVLYATSSLGQTQAAIRLHPPKLDVEVAALPVAEPGRSLSDGDFSLAALKAKGMTDEEAVAIYSEKMGEAAAPVGGP